MNKNKRISKKLKCTSCTGNHIIHHTSYIINPSARIHVRRIYDVGCRMYDLVQKSYFFFPKKLNLVLFTFILIFTSPSCVIDKTEDPIIRKKRLEATVTQKLANRRYQRMKNCQQAAIDIAEQRVDSILLAEAKLITIDTTGKPIKPIKPAPPTVAIAKDSSDVKPLFEEIPDTLQ